MSGAKQHFIPRMLLRAFRISGTGKVARVRVYRSDRSYTSPVEDVAAERFFYSELSLDGDETLDDLITQYENGLASDLAELNGATGPVSPATAARVVTHLLIRNDHVRGTMRAGAAAMANLVDALFGSDEKISALLGSADKIPGAQFRKIFAEHVADNPVIEAAGLPAEAMIPVAHIILRESSAAGYGEMTDTVDQVISRFQLDGDLQAKEAHARALASSLAPQQRVDNLERFDWRVEERDDLNLILPDFVALGWDRDGMPGSLLRHGEGDLVVVVMPLSPRRALIGSLNGAIADLRTFNAVSIPNCLSFFVSSVVDPELEALAPSIGFETAALLRESVEETVASFRLSVADEPEICSDDLAGWAAEPLGEIELHTDCANQENAKRLNEIIGQMIGFVRARFDIRSLRRVIINADYDQALASLDRGRFTDLAPPPVPTDAGYSIAYNVNVEHDGLDGIVLVLRASVAEGLLSDDNSSFGWAASVVIGQLARIGADVLERDDIALTR